MGKQRISYPRLDAGTFTAGHQFAGQIAHYKQVAFQHATQGTEARISGTIPTTLSDFKIDAPSFLAIPTKNEIPVRVEMTWRQQ